MIGSKALSWSWPPIADIAEEQRVDNLWLER
jgi:hypothetical protein